MRYSIVLLLALLLVLPASAKNDAYVEDLEGDWGSIDEPFTLPAPLEWKAVHGRFGEEEDIDAFSMHFDEAYEGWEIEVRVPVCGEHFTAVYPSVAVIGAGFESAEDLDLPFELAVGMGAVMLEPSERLEPRAEDSEFSFFMDTPNGTVYTVYYEEEAMAVDIPAEGDYTVAIWEPDGLIGAYFLWIGNEHPNDISAYQSMEDLEAAFSLINSGAWMGQDCEAPVETEDD